jgi:hypothetical protein
LAKIRSTSAIARHRAGREEITYRARVNRAVAERDRQMAEVARLTGGAAASSKAIKTVQALLTRAWSRADWREREEIVAAAAWLLKAHRLGATYGDPEPRCPARSAEV